ncbi:MAG: acyltransferase family protein [Janthinobacterium lividum]
MPVPRSSQPISRRGAAAEARSSRVRPPPDPAQVSGSHASRSGLSPPYLPQLDGLRGLAVILVLLAHASVTDDLVGAAPFWRLVQVLRTGYVGVDLFFALSGFLITRLLLAERRRAGSINLRRFYVRRVLRIMPVYYISVLVVGAIWPTGPMLRTSLLLYGFNYYLPFQPTPYPLEHVWSLAVEEQFYLIWPLLVGVLPLARMRLATLVAAPLLAVGSAVLLASLVPDLLAGELIYTSLPTRAFSLLLGSYVATREFEGAPIRRGVAMPACLAGGAILLANVIGRAVHLVPPGGWYWCGALVGFGVFAVGIVATAAAPDAPPRMVAALSWAPLRFVGRISYGLYLYHLPILYGFGINQAAVGDGGVHAARLALAYGLAAVAATLSYYLVERPLLRRSPQVTRWIERMAVRDKQAVPSG